MKAKSSGLSMLCQSKTTAVSFFVFVYGSYKLNENISFSSLKMTGPWVVSLQEFVNVKGEIAILLYKT